MILLPSTMQNTQLSPSAKRCVQAIQHRMSDDYIGIDGINIDGSAGQDFYAILSPQGLVLLGFPNVAFLGSTASVNLLQMQYNATCHSFSTRLHTHSVLKNADGKLMLPVSVFYLFPDCKESELDVELLSNDFIVKSCRFREWIDALRSVGVAETTFTDVLSEPMEDFDPSGIPICEKMRDVILNRIAPWATIPKLTQAEIKQAKKRTESKGVLENTDLQTNDSMIDVLRLDKKQIDEVNAIRQSHQLILACAGSGKSVILIAKCFKMASMDKDKKYLILCYNKNLKDYYKWQVDEAGFSERNVTCCTFYQLCYMLLDDNHIPRPFSSGKNTSAYFDEIAARVALGIKQGAIKQRYYGIFIDEVQIFRPEWYRICFDLLEDKQGTDHVLTICGDLTQNIRSNVKHGEAPWQGEGLPVFKGRTIHIETNYRNSVQINRFVNLYSGRVRNWLPEKMQLSMDTYLRGIAFRNGDNPLVLRFDSSQKKPEGEEAACVMKAIRYMHDEQNIGYSEIAVLLYNQGVRGEKGSSMPNGYPIKPAVRSQLLTAGVDFVELAWRSKGDAETSYEQRDGVSLISYEGALGIDYRGIIVAGISMLGVRTGTAKDTAISILDKSESKQNEYRVGFDALYLACTRAKDSLAIILPKKGSKLESSYTQIMEETIEDYSTDEGTVTVL